MTDLFGKDLFGQETIRALSWRQPFGTLMLHGKLETRSWFTTYRGLVLICISDQKVNHAKTLELAGPGGVKLIDDFYKANKINPDLVIGKAIAVGRLVNCRAMRKEDEKAAFVDYKPGLFVHFYEDVRRIEPIPWKGSQRWGRVDPSVSETFKFL